MQNKLSYIKYFATSKCKTSVMAKEVYRTCHMSCKVLLEDQKLLLVSNRQQCCYIQGDLTGFKKKKKKGNETNKNRGKHMQRQERFTDRLNHREVNTQSQEAIRGDNTVHFCLPDM